MWGEAVAGASLAGPPLFVLGHWRSGTTHPDFWQEPGRFDPDRFTEERWRLRLVPGRAVIPKAGITLRARHGVWVTAESW